MLMNNSKIETNENYKLVVRKYKELDMRSHFMIDKNKDNDKTKNTMFVYKEIRKKILEINSDEKYVVDVLIKYLYNEKKSSYKTTLWECFGDIIVDNLKNNLSKNFKNKAKQCENCGDMIEVKGNRVKYCDKCRKENQLLHQRNCMKKLRIKKCEVIEKAENH